MSIVRQDTAPTSPAAEWSVISRMLTQPESIGEIVAAPLAAEDFSLPETRLLFTTITTRHYASKPIDALIVGELCREDLASYWSATPDAVAELLVARAQSWAAGEVAEHTEIVKKMSTNRKLIDACNHAMVAIQEGKLQPEEIGDKLGTEVLAATAGSVRRSEVLDWMNVGRSYATHLKHVIEARENGYQVGVYTGLPFFDHYTSGIGPGELCFLAGAPGVGKTALSVEATLGFASRQMQQPPERQVATLFISCEMGLNSSIARVVSRLTGINGMALREGRISQRQFQEVLTAWKDRAGLPIKFNFASNFRLSQLRALIAEAIRRFNVGFVVLDHFGMIDTDDRRLRGVEKDEEKVRFLKENVAKDLNVAVLCLAHTVKVGRGGLGEAPRPRLDDLRGSGQIAAFADFVGIAWDPYKHLADDELQLGEERGDMELVWVKNRYGDDAMAPYRFDAPKMRVIAR